jgi:nucleoside-diphosphate-sugar epimerase
MGKRACEDVLQEAWVRERFPATRLRLPIVYGERDHTRRLEGYLWRLLDGGPLLVPDGGAHPVRHVYAGEVVRLVLSLLGRSDTFGEAYNVCQEEAPPLIDYLHALAEAIGTRPRLVAVSRDEVQRAGLDPVSASPFSGRWMSWLDPSRAGAELGFAHRPMRECLRSVAAWFLAHPPPDRPDGYRARDRELALARRLDEGPAA